MFIFEKLKKNDSKKTTQNSYFCFWFLKEIETSIFIKMVF